ncbi:MAG: helix-turn-helix transcriptional regulator [Myxococcaceae bacterium]
MRVLRFQPSGRLAPYVRDLRVVETDQQAERLLLPDTGVLLALRYGGAAHERLADTSTRVADASLTGLRHTARRMVTSARGGAVIVAFQPGGASAFFREPLHHLYGRTVELEALVARASLTRAMEELQAAKTLEARLAVVHRFLETELHATGDDPLVAEALARVQATRGCLRVDALARSVGLSRDRFEKRFRRVVGTSPRQLASLVRLEHVVELSRSAANLTQLALDAGYFDQSHFIREFRAFTGQAPRQFFGAEKWC